MHRMTRRQHAARTVTRYRASLTAMRASDGAVGGAYRWVHKQGPTSLALTVAGMVAFTVAAFTIAGALGWAVIGASCWFLEWLTRD